ncbi:hypothetical protein ACFPES_34815 [Paenibacillus sp. GCM10023248]|uniref:hypothetical protein n=1 Tax=unclassified Paenibacillus TaxID=185978 RepID=UPI0023784450|nr:hypothetical protein [Paenibacillus sp. MAHUQ-63]MDD9272203.1 hypothetical protein [Paenibacillus sp. MAHUQ-63]
MQNTALRPMGIGRILDRSFHLYRKHFMVLTTVMLILYGPFYLLQHLLTYRETAVTSNTVLDYIRNGGSLEEMFGPGSPLLQNNPEQYDPAYIGKMLLFVLILLPIMLLGLMPASIASVVHLVKANLYGEETPTLGQLLKKSFARFWPLAGSTFLDGLILVGIYMGLAIILIIFAVVFALGSGFSNAVGGFGGGALVFSIIFFIAVGLGSLITFAYFFIRWCYYLPFVALGEDSIGIGLSWNLTRRSFWRLFGMYVVLTLILYVFLIVIQLVIGALLGTGLGAQLLQSLITILTMALWYLPYAVSFFDLRIRNEGLGLQSLIDSTIPAGTEDSEPFQIDLDKKND